MDFKFQRKQINEMPESKILEEFEKAAKIFQYIEFGRRDFDKIANISSSTLRKHYGGSWTKGLVPMLSYFYWSQRACTKEPVRG